MKFTYNKETITDILKNIEIQQNFDLALLFAKKQTDYYVYNTAAMEGNTMTYPEVQTLLEGVTVGGHKLSEELQILNQKNSWDLLLDFVKNKEFEINKNIFCKLHEKVSYDEALEWGIFRNKQVGIGGTDLKPPVAKELDEIFVEGINEIKNTKSVVLQSLLLFLFSARNQFFFDGNKRTGRLMMNGLLLSNSYPILNIEAKNRLEFNKKMIGFYDTSDATDILKYLLGLYVDANEDFNK